MQAQDRLKIDGSLQMRTGIHVGDVADVDGDVFGEGVNIAARLQDIAEPGAVAISDTVHALLDGTLRPSFDDAGERALKNISHPLHVRARGGGVAGILARFEQEGFPRLAIRPVQTSDDRAALQEPAVALTGDLVNLLDANRVLTTRVSASPAPDAYVLAPVLRVQGDRLRLEARLTAPGGVPVLAEKIDGHLADSFDWQDRAARRLTARTFEAILAAQMDAFQHLPEDALTAEQLTLLTLYDLELSGPGRRKLMHRLVRLLAKAPDQPGPSAHAAANQISAVTMGFADAVAEFAPLLPVWMEKLDPLAPENSPHRVLLAFTRMLQTGNSDAAWRDIHRIIRNLPFDSESLFWLAFLQMHRGIPAAAMEALEKFDGTPASDGYLAPARYARAFILLQLGRYAEALDISEEAIEMAPLYPQPVRIKAALAQLGRLEGAEEAFEALDKLSPDDTVSQIRTRGGLADTPAMRLYFDGLRKAGMPE